MTNKILLLAGASLAATVASTAHAQVAPGSVQTPSGMVQTAAPTPPSASVGSPVVAPPEAPVQASVTTDGQGQVAPPATPQASAPTTAAEADAIVVTGSRIARQGTFVSPTPVTSVSQADLVAAAPSTLADGLRQLPSVQPGGGPSAGGGTGNGGQNFINLRALGATRTLTLVDSRRFTPTGPANSIDTNLIPQGLVERVDVVTGGASAAYGSDAVGGVINFVLNKRFEGLKIDLDSGISQRGDNEEYKFQVTAGARALDNRFHIVAAGEYYKNKGVAGDARDFRTTAPNELANPNGTPKQIRGTDLRTPYTTGGMVVIGQGGTAANNAQILGIKFDSATTSSPYDYGTISSDYGLTSGSQNGGDGFRVSTGQEIIRPLERRTLFGHAEYELSDKVSFFAEGSYGKTIAEFLSSPTTSTLTIQRTNPYLAIASPALVARMTTLGVTRFLLNRLTLERGLSVQDNENTTIRGLAGFQGKFGNDWSWDLSYQWGRNRNHNPFANNLITANFTRAVNAVTSNGQIVCADTISSDATVRAAAAGCQPFNPFGAGTPSTGSLDYVFGTSVFDTEVVQQVADVDLSGDLFNLPAGPLSFATGAEWRMLRAVTVADPISNAGGFRLVNAQDFYGRYSIKEIYGELQIPILKDSVIAKSLDLNVAGRHTDYSTSGGVNTWKVGGSWQIFNDLRLRATRSRDIRAPNLNELFATGRQNNITIDDTLRTGRTYLSVPNQTFGNADLKPEIAQTLTAGAVYRPSFIPGFNIAADYYTITIKDAIGNVGGNNAVQQCNLSNQTSPICAFVFRDPVTLAVIGTRTSPANLTRAETDGVDIEASYRVPLAQIFGGDPGTLNVRTVVGYIHKNRTISPLNPITTNDAGAQGLPHWRETTSVNYSKGAFSTFLQGRFIGPQVYSRTLVLGVDTDLDRIAPAVYLDGQFSVKIPAFGHRQELFLNVQNLLDRQPNYSPATGGATPLPTDTGLYDQVGRMFRVGLHAQF